MGSEIQERYRYRARDAAGAERTGTVDAGDEASALRELMRQGLRPLLVEPVNGRKAPPRTTRLSGRITPSDRIIVLRELATLLQAGVSVAEALPSVADAYEDSQLGEALVRITQQVNAGATLTVSVRNSSLQLPGYALALVQAGEASGDLATAMAEAAEQMEHDRRIADEMRNALIYPTILVVVGLLVIAAIFVGVVPRFANMLQSSRAADIPEFSRQVISAGVYVKKHLDAFSFGLAALVLTAIAVFSGAAGKQRLTQLAVTVPGLHQWLLEADLGRWATVLSALLANRVGVIEALQLSASAVRLEQVAGDVQRLARELERGRTLADALADLAWFPRNRLNLVRVGERSGQLPKTLATLGAIHSDAARSRQRRLLTLIEPAAILIIGAAIGFVMVAVMSAITSVNSIGL